MIKVTVYKNGNKTKSQHAVGPDGYRAQTNQEIFEMIRENPEQDFQFYDKNNKQDVTYEKTLMLVYDQERLKTFKCEQNDVNLLSRVIRAGGFLEYIKQMEETHGAVETRTGDL